jgi:hypothetical protein
MAGFANTDGGYLLQNDAGEFTVYDDLFETGGGVAGPGYIARWTTPNGDVLVDGLEAAWVSANDPQIGGIAIPAWHHYRANGETDIGIAVGRSTRCADHPPGSVRLECSTVRGSTGTGTFGSASSATSPTCTSR